MMSPESGELARGWLAKARSDLATARLLVTGPEKHFDTGSYHCQQAAEKALKAWLTFHEVVFPKTHSLEDLLALCIPSAPGFTQFQRHAEELAPLATAYRYPGDVFEPSAVLAARVLALAEELSAFCEQQIESLHK
jgi:HEPN domain-containing protein